MKAIAVNAMSGSAPLCWDSRGGGCVALPPAVAHPDQQVRDDQADPVVPPARLEYLAVRGVMAKNEIWVITTARTPALASCHQLSPIRMKPTTQAARIRTAPIQLGPVVAVAAAHQSISWMLRVSAVNELPALPTNR